MVDAERWIVLAHLLRPQGRKGEVLADLFTDFPERFSDHPAVWLAHPGFSGPKSALRSVAIQSFFLPVGRNAGRIVLHLQGVESIEDAERLTNLDVVVPAAQRPPLEDDAAYVSDLIGCAVFDREVLLGVVEDVQFPTSSDGGRRLAEAAPLLCVRSVAGDEILIPFARQYLIEMDLPARTMRMVLPEGLADVNR